MAGIGTTLAIYDQMSAPLEKIRSSLERTVSSFDKMKDVANSTFDDSSYQEVESSLQALSSSITHAEQTQYGLNHAMEQMGKGLPEIEIPDIPIPDPIPITWDVQEIDVFKNSGVERFQSEISSATSYLDRMNDTQIQIGRTAAGMDIIPDSAYLDIKNLTSRIGDIRSEIELLERNPMDLNVDQVNNQLETLRGSLSNAERQQNDLNDAMQRMDASGIQSSYNELNRTISNSERHLRDNLNSQQKFTQEVENSNNSANQLNGTFMKIAGTIAAAFSIKQVIGLSDEMTNIESRLNLINDKQQTTAELQNMIYKSAQRARGSYDGMADSLAQLEQRTSGLFASNAETLQFAENLNKQFVIAGTEQQGIAAATLQLNQAMGMGVLRGQEFNSIMEQTPQIIGMIADYMDVSEEKMKEMASEGQITAEIIKNAMLGATDAINEQFEQMPMTFAQIWQSFQNSALMAFQPVLQRINDIANSQAFQTFVNNAIQWVSILANFVTIAFEQMASLGQWVANHWSMIAPVVMGIVTALGIYLGYLAISNTLTAISTGIQTAQAIAAAVSTGTTIAKAAATRDLTVAQWALNSAMLANPITWVIAGVIALIAVIYVVIAVINHFAGTTISATGLIAGAIAWLGTFILNIFIMIINAGLVVINMLINAFQIGIWMIQIAFIGLLTLILLVFDGIVNTGIFIVELLANAWNIGIWTIMMIWIGLNMLVRNILQGILNFGISTAEGFANSWNDAIFGLQTAFYQFQVFVSKVLQAVGQGAIGVVNSVLSGISSLVNTAIGGINKLISMANNIPGVDISTVGTVDLKVGGGAQKFVDSIGSGLVAPVRAAQVSLNRSTIGDDYNPNIPSMPQAVSLGRSSATSDFLSSIEMPEFPKLEQAFDMIEFKDLGAAFDKGYEWGENLEQNIKDFDLKGSIMDWLGIENPNMDDLLSTGLEGIDDIPSIDELGGLGDAADKATGGKSPTDKALGKIADNTDDIAKDLGISKEDLKYMRDLASRDYANRYTNNEIILNFDNTNNVNNEMDLDGVVDYMTKGIEQAVEISVEGVYP